MFGSLIFLYFLIIFSDTNICNPLPKINWISYPPKLYNFFVSLHYYRCHTLFVCCFNPFFAGVEVVEEACDVCESWWTWGQLLRHWGKEKKTAAMVSVTFGQLGLVIGLELTQVYWVWLYIIWVRATIGYYRRVQLEKASWIPLKEIVIGFKWPTRLRLLIWVRLFRSQGCRSIKL